MSTDQQERLVDELCRTVAGKPADVCDWREMLRVRNTVDRLLNDAVNRRQNPQPPQDAA